MICEYVIATAGSSQNEDKQKKREYQQLVAIGLPGNDIRGIMLSDSGSARLRYKATRRISIWIPHP
jgi:hypothetical protein